jgi:hypothetical protein
MASCLRHSPIIDRAGTHGLCILPKLSIMRYQMKTCWAAAKGAMLLFRLRSKSMWIAPSAHRGGAVCLNLHFALSRAAGTP